MPESPVALYEGMFLLSQTASANLAESLQHVRDILTRAGAEVVVLYKWDERKLAYPIRGQKRGVYLLAYFRVRGTQIANIDRDCSLSELIARSLIIKADHIGDIELEQAIKDSQNTATEAKLRAEEAPADDDASSESVAATESE